MNALTGAGLLLLAGGGLLVWARLRNTSTPWSSAGIDWPRILQAVAQVEGGRDWGIVSPDDRGAGASWGIVQFNQKWGALGKVLARWRSIAKSEFDAWAGTSADAMINTLTGPNPMAFSLASWKSKLEQAGRTSTACQEAQRYVAYTEYMVPVLALTKSKLGLTNQTAGLVFDRAIQQGPGRAKDALNQVTALAGTADAVKQFTTAAINLAASGDAGNIAYRQKTVWDMLA